MCHLQFNNRDCSYSVTDDQIAKKFSEYFISIPIPSSKQDPILKTLDKYKDHPIIKLINAKNNS